MRAWVCIGRRAAERFSRSRNGATAIEFAILSPLFLAMLFAILTFGLHFGVANSVHQLCGDIARAAVAGIDEDERVEIAEGYVEANAHKYLFIKSEHLTLAVADSASEPQQFDVEITYDASRLPTYAFMEMFDRPPPEIRSVATVRHGGF